MDVEPLRLAGLTDGEIRTYLAILELGLSRVGPILNKSGITKSIIYQILEKLVQKGLVSHVSKDGVSHYQAASPKRLLEYVHERQKEMERNKVAIEGLVPRLLLLQNSDRARATLYEGFKGIISVHEQRYEKLREGDEYYFFGLPAEQPLYYHSYWQKDHARRVKYGIGVRMLYNVRVSDAVLENRNSFALCEARRMPFDVSTPAWIMGYKDTTVIGIPLATAPFAVELVSQEVADSFKEYFEWFWCQA